MKMPSIALLRNVTWMSLKYLLICPIIKILTSITLVQALIISCLSLLHCPPVCIRLGKLPFIQFERGHFWKMTINEKKYIAKLLSMADMLHSLTFQIRAIYSAFAATPELSGLTQQSFISWQVSGLAFGLGPAGQFFCLPQLSSLTRQLSADGLVWAGWSRMDTHTCWAFGGLSDREALPQGLYNKSVQACLRGRSEKKWEWKVQSLLRSKFKISTYLPHHHKANLNSRDEETDPPLEGRSRSHLWPSLIYCYRVSLNIYIKK